MQKQPRTCCIVYLSWCSNSSRGFICKATLYSHLQPKGFRQRYCKEGALMCVGIVDLPACASLPEGVALTVSVCKGMHAHQTYLRV